MRMEKEDRKSMGDIKNIKDMPVIQDMKEKKSYLEQYGLSNKLLIEKFDFRMILPEEADEAAEIEQICFPPNEACSPKAMKERIAAAADLFLVAVDKENGRIAGFLNGIATDESSFRDEFFTEASFHQADAPNIMLLGLDVRPEYRKQGLAHELVSQYLRREREKHRKMLVLTCLKQKVKFYETMGFCDYGISGSTWGGEEWHEMRYEIGK